MSLVPKASALMIGARSGLGTESTSNANWEREVLLMKATLDIRSRKAMRTAIGIRWGQEGGRPPRIAARAPSVPDQLTEASAESIIPTHPLAPYIITLIEVH